MKSTIWYIGDPMCSWCWGFSPQFDQLRATLKGQVHFRLRMGGLRPGTKEPMDDQLKSFLRHHWHEVEHRSGQPFSFQIMDRDDFVYDTEPPARAVIVMRHIAPEHEWEFFKAVQHAFYGLNIDTNKPETYYHLLADFDIPVDDFQELYESDKFKQKSWNEFAEVADLGIRGFPTVLHQTSDRVHPIAYGYMHADQMLQRIEAFSTSSVK